MYFLCYVLGHVETRGRFLCLSFYFLYYCNTTEGGNFSAKSRWKEKRHRFFSGLVIICSDRRRGVLLNYRAEVGVGTICHGHTVLWGNYKLVRSWILDNGIFSNVVARTGSRIRISTVLMLQLRVQLFTNLGHFDFTFHFLTSVNSSLLTFTIVIRSIA